MVVVVVAGKVAEGRNKQHGDECHGFEEQRNAVVVVVVVVVCVAEAGCWSNRVTEIANMAWRAQRREDQQGQQ